MRADGGGGSVGPGRGVACGVGVRRRVGLMVLLVAVVGAVGVVPAGADGEAGVWRVTDRVSVATDGTQADNWSSEPAISGDGRYVAFFSDASNLVAGDTNGASDVFVHDRTTGVTERVSVASGGTQADNISYDPAISGDGRYVAFSSLASNLVAGDTNGASDVFVHDRTTGVTERVSVASDGTQGNDGSTQPAISGDGRHVAFSSDASNLVDGDTNGSWDVFVHERKSGVTVRVSVASDGTQANSDSSEPAISADGRYVAFRSYAWNLVAGDTNERRDVFVHDRTTAVTQRVSVATNGTQANDHSDEPAISADGRYVAFESVASNLVAGDTNERRDVFVHERKSGVTERVSVASDGTQANHDSNSPAISADGRHVAFQSSASNLVAGDTNERRDVFVHDRTTAVTQRVSIATNGTQANGNSYEPAISGDGRQVAFESSAVNLVAGDTNATTDVFIAKRLQPEVLRYGGANRYETAALISAGEFPDPAAVDRVFVAVGTNFPDALAGAAVAGKLGAPLLLVETGSVPASTAAELARLGPATIVILGGEKVISPAVATALGTYAPIVVRLAGANRYATAVAISQYGFPAAASQVLVATGTGFADALAGGPAAVALNAPVLLTDPNALPQVVADEITRLAPARIVVVGGPAAVSDTVLAQLAAIQPNTVRISGANRYATAVAISTEAFGAGATRAYVATGLNFPDALAGAAAAGNAGAPILLVPTSSVPGDVAAEITRLGANTVVILGGVAVVTDAVRATLNTLVGN